MKGLASHGATILDHEVISGMEASVEGQQARKSPDPKRLHKEQSQSSSFLLLTSGLL